MQRSLAHFFTFVIDTIFVFISCVNCIFVFDQLRTVGWFLFVFNHESNVKDNLCRSELIKVRLFDENFSVFCERSYLCDALITSFDAVGRKMLDLSHTLSIVVSYKYLEFFSAFCVMLIMIVWVQTAARITLTQAGLGRNSMRFNGSLDCTLHTNTTYV